MAVRQRPDHVTRRDTDSSYDTVGPCFLCRGDQSQRHAHFLTLVHSPGGFEGLEAHLYGDLTQRIDDPERVRGYVKDIMTWVRGEVEHWAGYANPQTGAPLPWWETRRQAHAAAQRLRDQYDPRGMLARERAQREAAKTALVEAVVVSSPDNDDLPF